jgi:hypothetical protein
MIKCDETGAIQRNSRIRIDNLTVLPIHMVSCWDPRVLCAVISALIC